jgi:hypothetical protein
MNVKLGFLEEEHWVYQHVAACPRCRTATHIGALCPIGRKWLDRQLFSLLPPRKPGGKDLVPPVRVVPPGEPSDEA